MHLFQSVSVKCNHKKVYVGFTAMYIRCLTSSLVFAVELLRHLIVIFRLNTLFYKTYMSEFSFAHSLSSLFQGH